MRLVAGVVLGARGSEGFAGGIILGSAVPLIAEIGFGLLPTIGLWTPIAGVLVAALEFGSIIWRPGDPWIHFFLATLGVSLTLLGPGAWSIDSRLFGWRRIDIETRDRRDR